MSKHTHKTVFLICWLYHLSRCLTSATQVLVAPEQQYSALQLGGASLANANSQQPYSSDIRAFPFVVDPLIIIALIALPTIGMLGLSSLIMPLIPIALYLIQLFFPVGGSGRRKRESDQSFGSFEGNNSFDKEFDLLIAHLSQAFDKYSQLSHEEQNQIDHNGDDRGDDVVADHY